MAAPVLAPLLAVLSAGVAIGGALVGAAWIFAESRRRSTPPPLRVREPLPSWPEEAQKIHECARCGRRIVKLREGDKQIVRRTDAGVEHYHVECWDAVAGAPRR